jgi:hypothetical protein
MRWYDDPAVIPFDVQAGRPSAEWFRFLSAPGTTAIRVPARGTVQAWLDGEPMTDTGGGRFAAAKTAARAAVVAIRVVPETGRSGGAAIPEPVIVETDGTGVMALGDWSQTGILHNYSGGVRYGTTVTLTAEQAAAPVELDLGAVTATAEVVVNGTSVAVRVAPPWKADLTGALKAGENRLEILVYNTLSNHYQTLPSSYRGSPVSGLMGPVRLRSRVWMEGGNVTAETAPPAAGGGGSRLPAVTAGAPRVTTAGNIRVTASSGTLESLNARIADAANLARQPGMIVPPKGERAHDGGGQDFSALFNGTAGNRKGGDGTENDGATFVGLADGNALDLVFDPGKAPKGVTVKAIRTCAGHADGRASQRYAVLAAPASAPDRFAPLAEAACEAAGGLTELAIETVDKAPLSTGVRALRFIFKDGSAGFNVYREIAVIGQVVP